RPRRCGCCSSSCRSTCARRRQEPACASRLSRACVEPGSVARRMSTAEGGASMARAQSAGNDGHGAYAHPSPEERRRMIAEAAYYKALNRGFQGGDPVEDWLAAEREIDAMFPNPEQQREE